jgi:carbonic anhydrase
MFFDQNKKVLVLAARDQDVEHLLDETNINSDNIMIVSNFEGLIEDPYSDCMRSIIIAIYQEKVEEIMIVGSTEDRENKVDVQTIMEQMNESKRMRESIKTINKLFQYNIPKFPYDSVRDWLKGSKSERVDVEKIAEKIRQHPLVPEDVKVRGLVLDKELV